MFSSYNSILREDSKGIGPCMGFCACSCCWLIPPLLSNSRKRAMRLNGIFLLGVRIWRRTRFFYYYHYFYSQYLKLGDRISNPMGKTPAFHTMGQRTRCGLFPVTLKVLLFFWYNSNLLLAGHKLQQEIIRRYLYTRKSYQVKKTNSQMFRNTFDSYQAWIS